MKIEDIIVDQLKKTDTVADYMTPQEMIEYYKNEYPNDYKTLIKLYGD